MLINILYWRSLWKETVTKQTNKNLMHAHTREEIEAFNRRLVALSDANFVASLPASR